MNSSGNNGVRSWLWFELSSPVRCFGRFGFVALICIAFLAMPSLAANWKQVSVLQVGMLGYPDSTQRVCLLVEGDGLAVQNVYFLGTDSAVEGRVLDMALTAIAYGYTVAIDYQASCSFGPACTTQFFLQSTPITFTISGNAGVAGATLTYSDPNEKTVTANSSGDYSLTVSYHWSGSVTPSHEGYTFTPPTQTYVNVLANQTDQNYVATPVTYTLDVSKAGTGDGTVTSTPAGIDCGTTCTHIFTNATDVTLMPTANFDSLFTGWSGACSGTGACIVHMVAETSVTANFSSQTRYYPVTPCRVFDTRDASGSPILAPGSRRLFMIAGTCNIPTDAKAISANITVVNGSAVGELAVIAGNLIASVPATIQVPLSRARANNALIRLAADGAGNVAAINSTTGTVHLILDVSGYFK